MTTNIIKTIRKEGLNNWLNSVDSSSLHVFLEKFLLRDLEFASQLFPETKISSPEQILTEQILILPYHSIARCTDQITQIFFDSLYGKYKSEESDKIRKTTYLLLIHTKVGLNEKKLIDYLNLNGDSMDNDLHIFLINCLGVLSTNNAHKYFEENSDLLLKDNFFLTYLNIIKRVDPWTCLSSFFDHEFNEDVLNDKFKKSLVRKLLVSINKIVFDLLELEMLVAQLGSISKSDWKYTLVLNLIEQDSQLSFLKDKISNSSKFNPLVGAKKNAALDIIFNGYLNGKIKLKKLEANNFILWQEYANVLCEHVKTNPTLSEVKMRRCGDLFYQLAMFKGDRLNRYLMNTHKASFQPVKLELCFLGSNECLKLDLSDQYFKKTDHATIGKFRSLIVEKRRAHESTIE